MSTSIADLEKETLHRLREQFEAQGYKFLTQPTKGELPDFLQEDRPDALAIGPNETVVIEAKRLRTRASNLQLTLRAKEISSRPGWRLLVVYTGEDSGDITELSRVGKVQIDQAIKDARALRMHGHNRYVLVAAWSLFEALARRLYAGDNKSNLRALSPIQIVEHLAMDGYLDVDEAKHLRNLISLRNRSVHGDLEVSIPNEDIDFMLNEAERISTFLID